MPKPPRPSVPKDANAPTVLVIDDVSMQRQLLIDILEPHYHVRGAADGASGLAAAEQRPVPDLIMLDVVMPGMSGYDVLRSLRESPATRDVPVVLVTALGDADSERLGFEAGAVDYLPKPFRPPIVLARVRAHLERAAALRELAKINARLEAVVENLKAFSYSVSHDLHAPLRILRGMLDLLVEHDGERLSEAGRYYLTRSVRQSERMTQMIDDILAYSRADLVELHRDPLDLQALARDVVDELSPPEGSVTFVVEPLPRVLADRTMIRQVFSNLVSNAVKFTRGVAGARVRVRADTSEGWVTVHVEDNGPGFDPNRKERLFRLFSRLHSDAQFPGTGVGLATVKRLVERHGGKVEASSSPESGTRFSFSLPASA